MNMVSCQVGAMLTLHEDAFYEFFRPYRHPESHHDIWGWIGLETFGEDLELVKSLPVESIWRWSMAAVMRISGFFRAFIR